MQWGAILLTYAALFVLALADSGRGPSYPAILRHFSIGPGQGAHFFALASLSGLMANLTAKWWLEKLGAVRALKLSLLILSLACFILGLSGFIPFSVQGRFYAVLLAACILGPGAAGLSVTMNIIAAKASTPLLRRKILSGLHSLYGMASLLAPLILGFLNEWKWDWRIYYILLSPLPLLVFFSGLKVKLDIPQSVAKIIKPHLDLKKKLCFGGVFAFYVASEVLISSRLALYLETILHYTGAKAKLAVSGFFFFLLLGRILFSLVHFKGGSERYLLFSLLLTFLFYFIAYFIHPFGFVLCAFSMSWFYPCAMSWLSEHFGEATDYMITWVQASVGVLLVCMHWIFGLIGALLGVELAMKLAPLYSLLSLVCLLTIMMTSRANVNTSGGTKREQS